MPSFFTYGIEQFGTKRHMFENNFRVDKESYDYTVRWNAFKRMTTDYQRLEETPCSTILPQEPIDWNDSRAAAGSNQVIRTHVGITTFISCPV